MGFIKRVPQKQTNELQSTSLRKRFLKKYVALILIPLIIVSTFLTFSIYYIHMNNVLYQQVSYLRSIRKTWVRPSAQAQSVMHTLNSTSELLYYLEEDYYTQSERLYHYKKNLLSMLNNLTFVNEDIESIQIYANDPNMLQIAPFHTMDSFPIKGKDLDALEKIKPNELFWFIQNSGSVTDKPEFYAYSKIYSTQYVDFLGYVEIKINNAFLEEYIDLLNNNLYNNANYYIYHNNSLIFNRIPIAPQENLPELLLENNDEYGVTSNFYFFKQSEPTYSLDMLILLPNNRLISGYVIPLAICTFLLIACLYILSLLFFKEISKLSMRIGRFSLYMKEYHKQDIKPYEEDPQAKTVFARKEKDEFSTLVAAFNDMIHRNHTLLGQIHHLELLTKDAQLAAMQAQIHPHFIYGTLETIRMLAVQNDDWDVENIVCSFSKLMRYSLNHPSENSTLCKELEISRHYMNIQLVRFDDRLNFQENIQPDLPDICCPPFIIQPLLENAIVHGVSKSPDNSTIQVNEYIENDFLVIQITDNGNGIPEERLSQIDDMLNKKNPLNTIQTEQNGFALHNVSERLTLFYHGQASLKLYQSGEWIISEIKISKNEWENQICSG